MGFLWKCVDLERAPERVGRGRRRNYSGRRQLDGRIANGGSRWRRVLGPRGALKGVAKSPTLTQIRAATIDKRVASADVPTPKLSTIEACVHRNAIARA